MTITERTYENATPELLKNREQIRDRLRVALAAVTAECIDLRCVLGLDCPENLTWLDETGAGSERESGIVTCEFERGY